LKDAFRSLYDITLELNLHTIYISKIDVDLVPSTYIKKILQELFYNSPTKIILCDNPVTIPDPSDRNKIILENYASTIAGHKSITKTYKGILYNYFWSVMKTEIQNFIQEYRNCQLKKLVRVKIRQCFSRTRQIPRSIKSQWISWDRCRRPTADTHTNSRHKIC